jgi:hypothetical protein
MEVERTFEQWSLGSPRVKWSAVFAGWAVGLAIQMVLTLMGLGFGAWAIDIRESNPGQGIPIGAALWTGVSMLISAFAGGYVTSRLSGSYVRSDGIYHGIVVWGVNWLIFAWLTTTAMATIVGGAFSVFGTTLQTLGQGVSSAASTAASKVGGNISLSTDDLRRQLESVLQATGKKELQPGEIQKDAGQAAAAGKSGQPLSQVSEGAWSELRTKLMALDRDAAVNVMINRFGMSEAQAREVVNSTIGMLGPLQDTMQQVKQQSAAMGTEALDRLGTAALWLSLLALVTLAVSALGGMLGTPEESMLEAQTESQSFRTDIRRAG